MQQFPLVIRQLGFSHWSAVSIAMHRFTDCRDLDTEDEIWLTEHYSVFTQGYTDKIKYQPISNKIPLLRSDRGGKITYHGPGQQVIYVLIDLKRRKLGVRKLITFIEKAVVDTLLYYGIEASTCLDAPGVYINKKKICSIGLRILRGCSLHGFALNVSMDLEPFQLINPCGYVGLEMTQLKDFFPEISTKNVQPVLIEKFLYQLGTLCVRWSSADNFEIFNKI